MTKKTDGALRFFVLTGDSAINKGTSYYATNCYRHLTIMLGILCNYNTVKVFRFETFNVVAAFLLET